MKKYYYVVRGEQYGRIVQYEPYFLFTQDEVTEQEVIDYVCNVTNGGDLWKSSLVLVTDEEHINKDTYILPIADDLKDAGRSFETKMCIKELIDINRKVVFADATEYLKHTHKKFVIIPWED